MSVNEISNLGRPGGFCEEGDFGGIPDVKPWGAGVRLCSPAEIGLHPQQDFLCGCPGFIRWPAFIRCEYNLPSVTPSTPESTYDAGTTPMESTTTCEPFETMFVDMQIPRDLVRHRTAVLDLVSAASPLDMQLVDTYWDPYNYPEEPTPCCTAFYESIRNVDDATAALFGEYASGIRYIGEHPDGDTSTIAWIECNEFCTGSAVVQPALTYRRAGVYLHVRMSIQACKRGINADWKYTCIVTANLWFLGGYTPVVDGESWVAGVLAPVGLWGFQILNTIPPGWPTISYLQAIGGSASVPGSLAAQAIFDDWNASTPHAYDGLAGTVNEFNSAIINDLGWPVVRQVSGCVDCTPNLAIHICGESVSYPAFIDSTSFWEASQAPSWKISTP
jgi:hypothetical protein